MTLFGKFVFTFFGVVLAFLIFFAVTSFIKHDSEVVLPEKNTTTEIATTTVDLTATSTTASTTEAATSTKQAKNQPAFTDVLIKGGKLKCSVTQAMGTVSSNGTVYINDSKVRAEFSTSISNTTIHSTMLALNGYMYTWTDSASSTGSKIKMPTIGRDGKVVTNSNVRTWNGDQVKEYTCEAWTPDENLFIVPTNVTFTTQ
jgi:biopolymer transport protein ExbD